MTTAEQVNEIALDYASDQSREKILVIDDEAIVRQSIVAYLEDIGFDVIEAENGQQGIECFRQQKPDLVLCDLRMPEIDGLTVLRKINEEKAGTPVIVVSGAGVMADVVEALRLGASDYLMRPIVDLEVLKHSVERNIDRARLVKENRQYREELEKTNKELQHSLDVLREDMQMGRHVQQNMLPAPAIQVDDYLFEHRIIPSLYLSGDFVDYFKINDEKILFFIADVSGHGASSAFVTVLLKNLSHRLYRNFQRYQDETIFYPSKVLKLMNKELLDTALDRYITIFLAVLDINEHQLLYSTGGHYPYPIFSSRDKVYALATEGLPVGIVDGAQYEDKMLTLPEEFTLAMFSDGILEILPQVALSEKEAYLLDIVKKGCNSVGMLADQLQLNEIKDSPDDITVLFISHHIAD